MCGPTCEKWLYVDLAAQSIGAMVVGLPFSGSDERLRWLVDDCRPSLIVVEDRECLTKIRRAISPAHRGVSIIVAESDGELPGSSGNAVEMGFEAAEQLGASTPGHSETWSRHLDQRTPDEPMTIAYSSRPGAGPAKGALLTSRNIGCAWSRAFEPWRPNARDSVVVTSSLVDLSERALAIYFPIFFGSFTWLAENEPSIRQTISEVRPTLLLADSRAWSAEVSRLRLRIARGDWLKRTGCSLAARIRRRLHEQRRAGRNAAPWLRILDALGYVAVRRPLLSKVGYGRLRLALSAGDPLPTEIIRALQAWGVTLRQVYGLVECGGLAALQLDSDGDERRQLTPVPRTEVAAGLDGELLVRGDHVSVGYWGGSSPATDSDRWLHTGDLGQVLPDGSVRVLVHRDDSGVSANAEHETRGAPQEPREG